LQHGFSEAFCFSSTIRRRPSPFSRPWRRWIRRFSLLHCGFSSLDENSTTVWEMQVLRSWGKAGYILFFFQRIGNFAPQICFVGPVNLVSLFLPRRLEKGLGFPVAGRIEWTTGLARPLRCPHRISFFRQPQRLSRHNTPPFRRLDCFPLFSTAGKQREGGGKKGMEWKRSFAWSPLLATGWRNSCYEMTERS
jgi:hypothetical protein